MEGLEKVIIIGGADIASKGLSSTIKSIAKDIRNFSNEHSLNYTVTAFNNSPADPAQFSAYDYIKQNYTPGEPLIIYGYSLGGTSAVQLTKMLQADNINVSLLVTVDAALSLFDHPVQIPSNVDININIYQTSRLNILGSRGHPSEPVFGNNSTTIINWNFDDIVKATKEKGSEAHGAMDEDTKYFSLYAIKGIMRGGLLKSMGEDINGIGNAFSRFGSWIKEEIGQHWDIDDQSLKRK